MFVWVLLLNLLLYCVQCNGTDHLETDYENKFYCKITDGSKIDSEEIILVLSPENYYFYKHAKLDGRKAIGKKEYMHSKKEQICSKCVSRVLCQLDHQSASWYALRSPACQHILP